MSAHSGAIPSSTTAGEDRQHIRKALEMTISTIKNIAATGAILGGLGLGRSWPRQRLGARGTVNRLRFWNHVGAPIVSCFGPRGYIQQCE